MLDKKLSHFQTFGLKVFIFTAKALLYIGETGRCLRTRFGEHRCSVTSNDANQPVARHFNNGSHCVSDMKIRALCPISGSNDSCRIHEMHLISKLGTVHPLGINERFS